MKINDHKRKEERLREIYWSRNDVLAALRADDPLAYNTRLAYLKWLIDKLEPSYEVSK